MSTDDSSLYPNLIKISTGSSRFKLNLQQESSNHNTESTFSHHSLKDSTMSSLSGIISTTTPTSSSISSNLLTSSSSYREGGGSGGSSSGGSGTTTTSHSSNGSNSQPPPSTSSHHSQPTTTSSSANGNNTTINSSTTSSTSNNNNLIKRQQTPAFLEKLFDILEEGNPYAGLISWQPDGNSFIIKKVNEFSEIVLPKYFKHSNIQSYIRQLNMYGFSKTRHDSNHHEFTHKLFQRGRRDLLPFIRRKTQQSSRNSTGNGTTTSAGNAVMGSGNGTTSSSSTTGVTTALLLGTPGQPHPLFTTGSNPLPIPSFIDLSKRTTHHHYLSTKASSSSVSKSSEGESQVSQGGEDDIGDNLQYSEGPQSLESRIEQLESQLLMVTEHCLELTNQYNQLCEALQHCHKYHVGQFQHPKSTISSTSNGIGTAVIKREYPTDTNVENTELDGHPLKRMKSCDGGNDHGTTTSIASNEWTNNANHSFEMHRDSITSPGKKALKGLDEKFTSTDFTKFQTSYAALIPKDSDSFYPTVIMPSSPSLGEKLERKSYSVDLGGLEAITAAAHILDRGPSSAKRSTSGSTPNHSAAYQGGPLVKSFSYGSVPSTCNQISAK